MTPIMLGGKSASRIGPCLFISFLLFLVYLNRSQLSNYFDTARGHSRQWTLSPSTSPIPSTEGFKSNLDLLPPPPSSPPKPAQVDYSWAEDISVVYTWVNGSVPEQEELRHQYGGPKYSGRFRDNEDLRYSMRTWANNVAWHKGKIFIVSPTPPDWLDLTHPRIEWVDQNTIVPQEFLPVFSSNQIEPYLYRIKGLTERFIQLNDDYMIDQPLQPSDLFTKEGGAKFFYSRMKVADDPRPKTGIWFKSLLNTVFQIERVYGRTNGQTKFLKHAPYVYYKSAMEGVQRKFGNVFEKSNVHKFRHERDVLLPYLHHAYVINEGVNCCEMKYEIVDWRKTQKDSTLIIWVDDVTENVYNIERIGKPLFLTINDSMGRHEAGAAALQLKQFYRSRYGHFSSPFEKPESRNS